MLVEHLILSHHGSHEFGSPSLPQTREAIALHFLDDMDSKMGAMRATIDLASAASAGLRCGRIAIPRCAARCFAPISFWNGLSEP